MTLMYLILAFSAYLALPPAAQFWIERHLVSTPLLQGIHQPSVMVLPAQFGTMNPFTFMLVSLLYFGFLAGCVEVAHLLLGCLLRPACLDRWALRWPPLRRLALRAYRDRQTKEYEWFRVRGVDMDELHSEGFYYETSEETKCSS